MDHWLPAASDPPQTMGWEWYALESGARSARLAQLNVFNVT